MAAGREREEPLWTLDELTARVALALSVDYDGQPSGRVREVPDARIIRYYSTLGLVDRPLGYDGRVAIYTTRHLLQIVAIKRLQQRGLSLSEIQRGFLTLDEKALESLAAAPAEAMSAVPAISRNRPAPRDQATTELADDAKDAKEKAPTEKKFWNAAPAEPVITPKAKADAAKAEAAKEEADPAQPPHGTLTGVPISDDAVVLAAFARALDAQDLAAIRTAAAPLLAELRKRGLL